MPSLSLAQSSRPRCSFFSSDLVAELMKLCDVVFGLGDRRKRPGSPVHRSFSFSRAWVGRSSLARSSRSDRWAESGPFFERRDVGCLRLDPGSLLPGRQFRGRHQASDLGGHVLLLVWHGHLSSFSLGLMVDRRRYSQGRRSSPWSAGGSGATFPADAGISYRFGTAGIPAFPTDNPAQFLPRAFSSELDHHVGVGRKTIEHPPVSDGDCILRLNRLATAALPPRKSITAPVLLSAAIIDH